MSTTPVSDPPVSEGDVVDLRAYRFCLDPTPAQREVLAQHAGAARWAFNHALAAKIAAHQLWREQVGASPPQRYPQRTAVRSTGRVRLAVEGSTWILHSTRTGGESIVVFREHTANSRFLYLGICDTLNRRPLTIQTGLF